MKWIKSIFKRSPEILNAEERLKIIESASRQVGPGVFNSTIIVIASFLPVFLLTGMEGKLFSPLAYTKSFILIVDAFLAITLTPVLISFLIKGKLRPENKNPITRILEKIYTPLLSFCLRWRKMVIGINLVALAIGIFMFFRLGSEFMPPLDEGSLLFMPVTMPDVSNSEVKRLLQVQDKIIKNVPEVAHVLGKAGRANTATDNSPVSMIETIILLKPANEWREGLTKNDIINELNAKLQIPGITNGWTQPIINRINMLSTGIRTDVGIKVYGQNLDTIYAFSQQIKKALDGIPGVKDLYVEPITGGKYIEIAVKRQEIGRYGLSVDDVNTVVESALGGMRLTTTIEGRQRFSVNARFAQDFRDNIQSLKRLQVQTMSFGPIPLEAVAEVRIAEGPPMINSENAMLRGTVLFNVRERDLGSTVTEAQKKLNTMISRMPKGYFLDWSGQWENQLRANKTLKNIMPIVLAIIFLVLYFTYKSMKEALMSMITVPFALIGGVYAVYFFGVNLSVAVAVGFIALFGMAIETVMLMTIYLNLSMKNMVAEHGNSKEAITKDLLRDYVIKGATQRLRPFMMTVCVSLFGLVPILWATGAGSDVMLAITIPLIGGTITATIYVMLVTPIVFLLVKEWELKKIHYLLFGLIVFSILPATAQKKMGVSSILDSIQVNNPAVKMYDAEVRSMDEAAKGARSWMPPEISTGLWMVPYNPALWRKGDMGATGMGQYMIGGQQMLPNRRKQNADAAYMESMSSVEKEKKEAILNEFVNDAKQFYYEWIILEKKLVILEQNEKLVDFMIKNAEIRYKNGLEKISAYYKAKAALGNIKNMQLMFKNDINEKRIRINALMGRNAMTDFEIDTIYLLKDYSTITFDRSLFYDNRSDLKAIDKDINLTRLKQETEKQALKPQFAIRYEHMFGFGGFPMQYTLMGMMKLPLANWSSKMNKANIESLKWKATALQSQKEMMVNEYSGMAYGMRNEIELKKKQLKLYEQNIIPALKNNYKTMQLGYEQNTEELFMLFDAWETLNMTQLEYLKLLEELLTLQVKLERILQKNN